MGKVSINESTLTAIGTAIREKTGKTDLIAPGDMPLEIRAIESGGSGGSDLEVPASMSFAVSSPFEDDNFSWFLNEYADRVTFKAFQGVSGNGIFQNSKKLVNAGVTIQPVTTTYMDAGWSSFFSNCNSLKILPTFTGKVPRISSFSNMFYNCYELEEIPENFYTAPDTSTVLATTSSYTHFGSYRFYGCHKLRTIPRELLCNTQYFTNQTGSACYNGFTDCYNLDRLVNIPVAPLYSTMTSNMFTKAFSTCWQLKELTFETNADGSPYVVKWAKQDIQLFDSNASWNSSVTQCLTERRGAEHKNKNPFEDADAWYDSGYANYSGYDHDAAVATLNSLPDTSAYVATVTNGQNYIRLPGVAGGKWSQAVNTLTDAEIAVATEKGWTVILI